MRSMPRPPLPDSCAEQTCLHQLLVSETVSLADWVCSGRDVAGEEWNPAAEVIVTRRGAFVRSANGIETVHDAATVAFWGPREEYRIRHLGLIPDACTIFSAPEATLRELLAERDPSAGDRYDAALPGRSAAIAGRTYLAHRFALNAARIGDALAAEELAIGFLRGAVGALGATELRRNASRMRSERERYAPAVRAVVAKRPECRLSLTELARAVGCSPFHLTRRVAAETGVPVYRLVRTIRLREALDRLLETSDEIGAIGIALGFASHSHFTDSFRREFGVSPREVRGGHVTPPRVPVIAHRSNSGPHRASSCRRR